MSETCPSRIVLHRIGARWTVFILNALEHGPVRFTAIVSHIRGITPKVLSESLKTLCEDGLVRRIDRNANPPHVEYELTDLGVSLLVPLRAVRLWAEEHTPDVLESRAAWSAGDR